MKIYITNCAFCNVTKKKCILEYTSSLFTSPVYLQFSYLRYFDADKTDQYLLCVGETIGDKFEMGKVSDTNKIPVS